MGYRTIMVGTDGSATASEAARKGFELAEILGADVTLVHVGDPLVGAVVLEETAKGRPGAAAVRSEAVQGDPADRIVELAGRGEVDLVVVGDLGLPVPRLPVRPGRPGDQGAGEERPGPGGAPLDLTRFSCASWSGTAGCSKVPDQTCTPPRSPRSGGGTAMRSSCCASRRRRTDSASSTCGSGTPVRATRSSFSPRTARRPAAWSPWCGPTSVRFSPYTCST